MCEAESDRLDSEMSMIRYIAWAIPSIGFLGTVRGIGQHWGKPTKPLRAILRVSRKVLGSPSILRLSRY